MPRKLGRPKAGDEVLSRDRILSAALQLIDERGVHALSMRKLATMLGVDPMAIYHHLPSKQALITGIVEHVFSQLHVRPVDGLRWQERVRAFAHAYHNLARRHPHLVLYLVSEPRPSAEAAVRASEELYAALAAAKLSPQMIVRSADVVVDYLNGFVLGEGSGRLGQPDERMEFLIQLAQQPLEQVPTLTRVYKQAAPDEILSDLNAGLDIILAGIQAVQNKLGIAPAE